MQIDIIDEATPIDEDFGEVVTRKCSFCEKTYDIKKFFAIPSKIDEYKMYRNMLGSAISIIPPKNNKWNLFGQNSSSKNTEMMKSKKVNEGICLKCMMIGIMNIYDNDVNKIKEGFDLMLKKKIADDLDK